MKKVLILNQFYFKTRPMESDRYKVDFAMLFRGISVFLKPLRFAHQLLGLPLFDFWYIKNWEEILKGYDLIILHDSEKLHANYFIDKITKHSDKNAKLKLYYWNQVYDLAELKLNNRWEVLSFDYKDSLENNLRYVGGFFLPEKMNNVEKTIDLFFVGTNKGRFPFLQKFEDKLKESGIKTLFFLVSVKHKFDQKYSAAIPYDEVINYVSRSKGIVDITKEGQVGLTLRAYEALFYNKVLVSNNTFLKNYDFFDQQKIYILKNNGEDAPNIARFLKGDPVSYSPEIIERYSFLTWIERIDKKIEFHNVHL